LEKEKARPPRKTFQKIWKILKISKSRWTSYSQIGSAQTCWWSVSFVFQAESEAKLKQALSQDFPSASSVQAKKTDSELVHWWIWW
jgi:hypothetical protein